jgi:CheY-like chemotaxis protein
MLAGSDSNSTGRTGQALPVSSLDFLAGGGEMGERMRALNWLNTPFGAPSAWPQSLKTIVRVMLDSRYAMWMLWGPELTFFCNDAYLPTVGIKRDWVLGARSDKVWEEIWPDIGPRIERVLEQGQATWDEGLLLYLERSGFPEETYHTFSYSPVYDDGNRIAGMLCVVTEVSEKVIGERRLRVLRDLATRATGAETVQEACDRFASVLAEDPLDAANSLALLLELEGHEAAVYRAAAALEQALSFIPSIVLLDIGLPEMDGYEVARRLRAMTELSAVRLVAVTGYGRAEDHKRTREAGFDDHLTKPVDLSSVQRSIAGLPSGDME